MTIKEAWLLIAEHLDYVYTDDEDDCFFGPYESHGLCNEIGALLFDEELTNEQAFMMHQTFADMPRMYNDNKFAWPLTPEGYAQRKQFCLEQAGAMTNQEIFDRVAFALLRQNAKSLVYTIETSCMYRGQNGLKCAAGHLIPDAAYTPALEGKGVRILQDFFRSLGFTHENLYLISSLQNMHDAFTVDRWPARLVKIAAQYNLNDWMVL